MTRLFAGILIAALLPAGSSPRKDSPASLASLVNTEREFAATSLREGIRTSFMKYFADDGVSISPTPHLYKQTALKVPPPAHPLARTLYWEPILADVSSSGDLGYTMGPSTLKDSAKLNAPVWYGFYFTVWKKQIDGTWKVAVDVGTGSTNIVEKYFGQKTVPAIHAAFTPRGNAGGGKAASRELLDLDRKFPQNAGKGTVRVAYEKLLDVHACAMREGLVPITGKDAILAYLVRGTAPRVLEPMRAEVSNSGDMGYTYGAHRASRKAPRPAGYYVRLWRKDAKGKWTIALEVVTPAE